MNYEQAHEEFIRLHLAGRTGERRGRLERGHRHAEALFLRNVWWPLRDDFCDLHPEYEVLDWRGRSYFADFSFMPGSVRLLLEIKGYAAHVKDMDRQKYSNELNRETFLCAMGYQVISFAYDDVEQRPELCITLLRMVLSRCMTADVPAGKVLLGEREIMRFVVRQGGSVRPRDIAEYFLLDPKTVRNILHKLCEKGWLNPVKRGEGVRKVRYELTRNVLDYWG
ncbi:BlaI/MecI/CopY family transcriptional regulator [Paenibacillus sp. BR2-3]|uniref:BlaI/MecI/CopY family transcriptional regulator n=1 Tax=Paenibacillus sp. BR2-3 TaxID=3048494 RepID=UPI003977CDF3